MSRWFRFYDDAVNDPKVQRLEPKLFKAWVNLLCLASRNDGYLPHIEDVSFSLRVSENEAGKIVDALIAVELIDEFDGRYSPHNWKARQFKSDVSNERVKRHRKRKSNGECNVTSTVTVTPPETETETETDTDTEQNSEANASAAVAPVDHRKRLFDEGLKKLARMTGKGPDACRSFVGKCLKAAGDDAVTVLGLIEEAERNQVVDPSGWIAARLKPTTFPQGNTHGKRTVQDAARDLVARVRAFDEPEPTGELRGPAGGAPLRLLSQG